MMTDPSEPPAEPPVPPEENTLEDDLFGAAADYDDRGPLIKWQPPANLPGCRDLGVGAAGFGTFCVVDLIIMWGPLMGSSHGSLPGAVALALLAFGLGGVLIWQVGGSWRQYGIGLMAGWAAMTLLSVGLLTGINP
jgi:hypothetical protein